MNNLNYEQMVISIVNEMFIGEENEDARKAKERVKNLLLSDATIKKIQEFYEHTWLPRQKRR